MIRSNRPWWWWINPWLYIARRDRAYEDALDTIRRLSMTTQWAKEGK